MPSREKLPDPHQDASVWNGTCPRGHRKRRNCQPPSARAQPGELARDPSQGHRKREDHAESRGLKASRHRPEPEPLRTYAKVSGSEKAPLRQRGTHGPDALKAQPPIDHRAATEGRSRGLTPGPGIATERCAAKRADRRQLARRRARLRIGSTARASEAVATCQRCAFRHAEFNRLDRCSSSGGQGQVRRGRVAPVSGGAQTTQRALRLSAQPEGASKVLHHPRHALRP